MAIFNFATNHDPSVFQAVGETLQEAFESLSFLSVDYCGSEALLGERIDVWGWDKDGQRHDWVAYFE